MLNGKLISFMFLLLSIAFGSVNFIQLKKHSEIFIPNVDPFKVFMIFGNFTNFFLLEPNLIMFKLEAEYNGEEMVNISARNYNEFLTNHRDQLLTNHQSWSYVVSYEEYYQHLPAILTNKNQGHFILSVLDEGFQVISNHTTEYLPRHPINTRAINTFKKVTDGETKKTVGTLVIEDVYYESPLLFIVLAIAEVEAQRTKVLNALANWKYN